MKNYIKWTVAIIVAGLIIWYLIPKNHSVDDISTKESLGEIPNQVFDVENTLAYKNQDTIYSDFRENFKYHFQTVGLAEYSDSSYTFVVSEPSPQVSEGDIKKVFSQLNCDFQIKQHKIGYDGFAKDMLIVVGKATKENITHLRNNLHTKLYFTSYKSERSTIELPVKESRQYFSKSNLNYEISSGRLDTLLIIDNELFVDKKGNTFLIKNVLNNDKYGVFSSKNAGYVIWVIDKQKNNDLNLQKQNIRQFTLDADLILGAFSNDKKLVVVGRERVTSLAELPPLNIETILLLASVKESELSQSLDILDLLAGKMQNNKDWCPTYLSKELENTEFGHLLTITDILLKDWSEHGNLKYEEYNYPKPESYPFYASLSAESGVNELVYNWSTIKNDSTGLIFKVQPRGENYMVWSILRTGSLLVSYFNSQENEVSVGEQYERQAYEYFANTNNTDLARVVQYCTLYELFSENHICYKGPLLDNNYPQNKPYLLKDKVQLLLTNIRDLSSTEKNRIARNISEDIWADNRSQQTILSSISGMQNILYYMDEKSFSDLCSFLSYPRGDSVSASTIETAKHITEHLNKIINNGNKGYYQYFGIDMSEIMTFYKNSLKDNSSLWIKTPSLVILYYNPYIIGGHNLSVGITHVNSFAEENAIREKIFGYSSKFRDFHKKMNELLINLKKMNELLININE